MFHFWGRVGPAAWLTAYELGNLTLLGAVKHTGREARLGSFAKPKLLLERIMVFVEALTHPNSETHPRIPGYKQVYINYVLG